MDMTESRGDNRLGGGTGQSGGDNRLSAGT